MRVCSSCPSTSSAPRFRADTDAFILPATEITFWMAPVYNFMDCSALVQSTRYYECFFCGVGSRGGTGCPIDQTPPF